MMLYKLLIAAGNTSQQHEVVVLMDKGKLGAAIEALNIPVFTVGMPQGQVSLPAFGRLVKLIRFIRPAIIQGWTYHGNFAAAFAGTFVPRCQVLWNIRHTPYFLGNYKRLTYLLIRFGAILSGRPAAVVYNSHESAGRHRKLGYRPRRELIIPNGFDLDKFKPSEVAKTTLRKRLGLPDETLIVGMVARYHPMKDHENFIHAAELLHSQLPNVHFLLAGDRVDPANQELVSWIRRASLESSVHLLGERSDIHEIMAGLDIATLTSAWGDAFPNVIGEAMACGVPCAVTDVGDSPRIVGSAGIVVPPKDLQAMARAWRELIELTAEQRQQLGRQAHQRIEENYSMVAVARQYEGLYEELLD
jgi:glycosyltransferase involved in cell wall biosynthesis